MSDTPRGRFVWYELLTTEPDAAARFYRETIGWSTAPWDNGAMPYTLWLNGQTSFGGIMELPEEASSQGAPPNWLIYISTPDLDDTVEQAQKKGGRLVAPVMDIPQVGRIAVMADPQGAVFAAYTPEDSTPGHDGPPTPGFFSWHELATTDQAAAWEFYRDLFGWKHTSTFDMGEAGPYHMFGLSDMPTGAVFDKPPEMPGPPFWLGYINVTDIDDTIRRVRDNGGQVLLEPMEVPGGDRVAQCMDPQGAAFALHETAR